MVTQTLLNVPGPMFLEPAGAAQEGGSLMERLTVPIAGLCIEELPPPQLMMIRGMDTMRSPNKSVARRPFSHGSDWAIARASEVEQVKLCAYVPPCAGQNAGSDGTVRGAGT